MNDRSRVARWLAIPAGALVVALGAPALADATIRPQVSIHGISLNMKGATVKQRLGQPKRISAKARGGGLKTFTYTYPRLRLQVRMVGATAARATVTGVTTTNPNERTRRGLGVGSTVADVQRVLPSAVCQTFTSGTTECTIGGEPGEPRTTFAARNGLVVSVAVGVLF